MIILLKCLRSKGKMLGVMMSRNLGHEYLPKYDGWYVARCDI